MVSSFDRLKAQAARWQMTVLETSETSTAVIAFGRIRNASVVLKIVKEEGDEWNSGEVLRSFQGHGTVRVLNAAPGALLVERLEPGGALVDLVRQGRDDEATETLAGLVRQMAGHRAPVGCATVEDWSRGFDRYLQGHSMQIPHDLVCTARDIYQSLAATQSIVMLLHGDLQHYNVLSDKSRGWVAIDPKGVVGELEYEVGAMLRNPTELPHVFTAEKTIRRRLKVLSDCLDLNYERTISWAFAQAVLSAIWDVEDGYPVLENNGALRLAKILQRFCSNILSIQLDKR